MDRAYRILVVDDDPDMLDFLRVLLNREGFEVIEALDGASALRAAYNRQPDAILLDIMMAGLDGFDVCNRLREMTDVPIIFVTAKGDTENLVRALTAGGDDYIAKPFQPAELLSRLRATLRRAGKKAETTEQAGGDRAAELDDDRRELVLEHRTVYLTPKELQVVHLLLSEPGKVFSTEAITAHVWGDDQPSNPNLVKQYMCRLRRKIEVDPRSPRYLRNVRGEGYYFDTRELT
ncbi:MAG: response regulator transcription factor [Anaerolineales bacterium]|nr:response regulator transcription factor [Anaerolineales bacterium]